MKKTLKLVTSAALLAAVSIPVAGCSFLKSKNVDKVSPYSEYNQTYTATFQKSYITANSKHTSIDFLGSDGANIAIVQETRIENSESVVNYRLLDLTTGMYTEVRSQNQLKSLGKGLFYSVKTTDWDGNELRPSEYTYTLYSATSTLVSDVKGSVDSKVFTQENGTRWYVDYNGTVQQENDPFAILFTDYQFKVDDYYVSTNYSSSMGFNVYNKDGELEHIVSLSQTLKLSEDADLNSVWAAGGNLFIQIEQPLPDDAKDYDFITAEADEVKKYELKTYSYSFKKNSVKEIKDFPYYVDDSYTGYYSYYGQDYAILEIYEIIDKHICADSIIQSFDKNGKVYFDIQNLVPDAIDIDFYKNYTVIKDSIGMTHIYQEKDCLMTMPANSVNVKFTDSNELFYKVGSTLYIYDTDTKSISKSIPNVSDCGLTENGNIWYSSYDEINKITNYSFYNVETGMLTPGKTITENQTVIGSFSSTYCIISNATSDGTSYTLYFPDSNIQEINSRGLIKSEETYYMYNDLTSTEYTIISVQSKDAEQNIIYNYYVLTEITNMTEK